jgi:hypothetical protein
LWFSNFAALLGEHRPALCYPANTGHGHGLILGTTLTQWGENQMNMRLFVVTKPFTARDEAGAPRIFDSGQEIFAEYPVRNSFNFIEFEQDKFVFRASAKDFHDSTRLKCAEPETS